MEINDEDLQVKVLYIFSYFKNSKNLKIEKYYLVAKKYSLLKLCR